MPDDPNGSGAMPDKRPAAEHLEGGDRDPQHEGLPTGDDEATAKGGPPHDDRLSGEIAHAGTGDAAPDADATDGASAATGRSGQDRPA